MPFPKIEIPTGLTELFAYQNTTGGSYNNSGKWASGTPVIIISRGVILPLTEKDLQYDINGTYTESHYKLYTTEELENSQIITHNLLNYEIQEQDDRLSFANYRKYIIRRVEVVNE